MATRQRTRRCAPPLTQDEVAGLVNGLVDSPVKVSRITPSLLALAAPRGQTVHRPPASQNDERPPIRWTCSAHPAWLPSAAGVVTESARQGTRLLMAGGVLSALNGAAHFVLPVAHPAGGWAPYLEGLYEPVRWALYASNAFFGVLLVLGGALTVAVARSADVPRRVVGWVAGGMAGFWVLAAVYEIVVPFPIPEAQLALPTFSLVVAALYLAGVLLRLRSAS